MPTVTFTVTGRLKDYGLDPIVGQPVTAVGTPHAKIDDDTIFSDLTETEVSAEDGTFTLTLASIPGLWYLITGGRAMNPVRIAAYTPDPGDPTTGTAFAPGTVLLLSELMDESPTPGYQGILVGGVVDHGELQGLGDDDHPQYAFSDGTRGAFATTAQGAKADTAVQPAALAAEASTRIAADAALLSTIGSETTARLAGDSALDTRVDALEAAPPPDLSGYATDAELSTEASTRAAADTALDGRVDVLEAAPGPDVTAADLAAHAADTTGVHGITDTAALVVTTDPRLSDARTPTAHTHDDRYYTEAETDALIAGVGGGVTDHGALTGLADDDHTQYALADGTRGAFATTAQGATADTAVQPGSLAIQPTGLVGDDATDNQASLQAALNIGAAFASRREILLPAGTFYLATPIDVAYPVHIKGAGKGNTIIRLGDTAFTALAGNVTIEGITFKATTDKWLLTTQASGASFGGWTFRDCIFDKVGLNLSASGRNLGNGTTETTATRVATNPTVDHCEFFGYGGVAGNGTLNIAGTLGARVTDCHIHDNGVNTSIGEAIKVMHFATGTVIDACLIERPTRDGIDLYNSIASTVSNTRVYDPGANGIEAKWAVADTTTSQQHQIIGNRVERAALTAFNVDSPKVTVIGNYAIDTVGNGFRFSANTDGGATGTSGATFIGNHAIGGQADGFSSGALATNVTFIGNVAMNNTGFGFAVIGANSMMGNVSTGNTAGNYTGINSSGAVKSFIGNLGSAFPGETRLGNNVPIVSYLAAGTTSFELFKVNTSDVLLIGSSSATAPTVRIQTSATGSIDFVGKVWPSATNTYDLGGTSRKWKDVYVAGVLKTGTTTTAGRPTAASAGAGGQMYDTTLSRPIFSDGTTWREAGTSSLAIGTATTDAAPGAQTINAQTGTTYTAVAGDVNKLVTLTNAGAIALSIPGSVFTAGQRIDFIVLGAGMVTVAGSAGATVNGTPSLVSRAQYSAFSVIALSATSFVVVGDMA